MTTHAIGDRVVRPEDVFDEHSRVKVGTVVRVYSDTSVIDGRPIHYPELYQVEWDDGTIGRAYLPHGIRRFPACGHAKCLRWCMPDGETIAFGWGSRDEEGRFETPCWVCAQAAADEKVWPSAAPPGHIDAIADGCCCPVIDNAHGKRSPSIIHMDCPLHGRGTL